MKKSIYFIVLTCVTVACIDDQSENGRNRFKTVFEGKWKWLKTDGVGIAGPYSADSITVGYSMVYEFHHAELRIYRDDVKVEQYTFTYTVSDKPEDQILSLKSNGDGVEQPMLWEIKMVGTVYYLYLRNAEPCCDNTFEHQFRLVSRTDIGAGE